MPSEQPFRPERLLEFTYFRGRVALAAILRALGIGRDHEVAVQAFTCTAVPEAVLATGAKPRFIDIESSGVNMSPDDLRAKLTPRTRAIVAQHTFGVPARIHQLAAIAAEHGIPLIEDCCHTFSSTVAARRLGTFGVASFYSYEWGKPIVAGVGGSALVDDPILADTLRRERSSWGAPDLTTEIKLALQYVVFNAVARPWLYWPVKDAFHALAKVGAVAGNYNNVGTVSPEFQWRMARLPARRLRRRLALLDRLSVHSRRIGEQYRTRVKAPHAEHVHVSPDADVVWARYPVFVCDKDNVLRAARRANVELGEWYATPIHPLQGSDLLRVNYAPGSCPVAERRAKQVVHLPTHIRVRQRDVDRAVTLINSLR